MTAGAFAWYVIASHVTLAGLADDVVLVSLTSAGALAALALSVGFALFTSRICGCDYDAVLQTDAYSYVPLLGLWLYLFAAPATVLSATALASGILFVCAAVKLAELARYVKMMRLVAAVFLATRVPLIIIAPLAKIVIGERQGQHWSPTRGVFLDVWGRWDAQHYLTIATQGYHGKDVAFFPLYPLLIKTLGTLIGDHLLAALIISNLAFFAALAFLYALTKLEFGDDDVAFHAIFYTAIFPTAIFFSAVYTESLFLALAVASVYFARRGNFVTSGIFGALASAARVEGILLALPLAYEVWHAWRERRGTSLARGMVGLALVPAGLLAYMGYLYALVGDPFAFHRVQASWNRHLAPPWVAIGNAFAELGKNPWPSTPAVNHLIELAFTAVFIALLIAAFRLLRPSYSLYFAASLLVPMSTASLMSMPRFVLVVFPAFMLLALWGRRPLVNSVVVSLSLPLLGLFTVFFADWFWLA